MRQTGPGVHVHPVDVRFGDCDPAGIVYFPRFYDLFHQAMESWFGETLGHDYAQVVQGRKIGFPAVHSEADFSRPCAFGDKLVVELSVVAMGRTSLRLGYAVRGHDDPESEPPRVRGLTVVAAYDLDPSHDTYRRAIELPADLRAAIEQFMSAS